MTDADISELTVDEIEDAISEMSDPGPLRNLLEAEEEGKDRVTATDAIKERIDEVTNEDVSVEEVDADDGDAEPDRHNPHGEFVKVRPANSGGHIAGYSFADGEVKEVKLEAKVQRSLSRGELQLIR